jgi:START domain
MVRLFLLALCSLFVLSSSAQYKWKLEKDKDGIKVYLSDVAGSPFKAIKVECTLKGTYAKLISILTNVSNFEDWIYRNKTSKIIRQNSPLDFIYYSETSMPWPLSNRDAVIHMRIRNDSLPRVLTITGSAEPSLVPNIPSKVRVSHYKANWRVTMPTAQTVQITYLLELDPGGSIPAWIANSFADKGPYETFSNIADQLKK